MLAPALSKACLISLDPVPFHEPVHEIEYAADRDGGMQGSLVPTRRKNGIGIGLRHAGRCKCQFLHEREERPKLGFDRCGAEILDETVYCLRSDSEQFRRRAVPAVAILASIER